MRALTEGGGAAKRMGVAPVSIQEGDQSILLRNTHVRLITATSAAGLEEELEVFLRERMERILMQPIQVGVAPTAPAQEEGEGGEGGEGGDDGVGSWWALVVYTE